MTKRPTTPLGLPAGTRLTPTQAALQVQLCDRTNHPNRYQPTGTDGLFWDSENGLYATQDATGAWTNLPEDD